jgi:hypothetical protein
VALREAREEQCHHSGQGQQAAGYGQRAAKQVRDLKYVITCYVMLCYVMLQDNVAKDNNLLGMGSGQPNRCVVFEICYYL